MKSSQCEKPCKILRRELREEDVVSTLTILRRI